MTEQKSNVDQRIQNAVYGTPKIKPDEQRRYLGTFRERVWLTITVIEAQSHDWSSALAAELKTHPDSLVIINGNLDDKLTSNYIQIANQMQAQFTIKTGMDIKTTDDSFAIVVCDHQAVYESPVDVQEKYGHLDNGHPQNNIGKKSLIKKIFHF